MLSISELKGELESMLHGTTLGQIVNVNGVLNRAARQLMLDIDPQETKRMAQFNSPVYYRVWDYALPSDIKGNKVIDLIPLQQNNRRDRVFSVYNQPFDIDKNWTSTDQFTIISDTGNKYIRVNYNNKSLTTLLDQVTGVSDNGIWVASGTASNLLANSQILNNGLPTVTFDATTGVATLTNSTIAAQDLSLHFNQGASFFSLYLNSPSLFTSATIKVGSDASNYYITSVLTTQFNGFAVSQGYNQFGDTFANMTKVGTPDLTKVNYVQLNITFSSAITGVAFFQLQNSLGFLFDIEYYSKYLFRDNITGAWQEKVTDDSNYINLDTESYNIFLYLCQKFATQQALGQDASYDTFFSDDGYQKAVARYKRIYKSELTKPQNSYYTLPRRGYNGILGSGNNNPY
jgi:hypothetical protein